MYGGFEIIHRESNSLANSFMPYVKEHIRFYNSVIFASRASPKMALYSVIAYSNFLKHFRLSRFYKNFIVYHNLVKKVNHNAIHA